MSRTAHSAGDGCRRGAGTFVTDRAGELKGSVTTDDDTRVWARTADGPGEVGEPGVRHPPRDAGRIPRLIDLIPTPLSIVDPSGRSLAVNPAYLDLVGLSEQEVLSRPLDGAIHPADVDEVRRALGEVTHGGGAVETVLRVLHGDGTWRRVRWTILADDCGERLYVVAAGLSREPRGLVGPSPRFPELDRLTMLPVREELRRRTEDVLLGRRPDTTVGLVHLTIGRVSLVNDGLGRHAGNELLAALARRLERVAGPDGVVARLVGAEFAVLFPCLSDDEELDRRIRSLQHEMSRPYSVLGHRIFVTVTVGAAAACGHGTADELLEWAEVAADRALETSPGSVIVYDEAFRAEARRFILLSNELRAGLELGAFVPHYQPLVELPGGRPVGVEVLARWVQPDGVLPAGRWVEAAQRAQLMAQISGAVRRRALIEAAQAPPVAGRWYWSVNIEPDELLDEGFVDRLDTDLGTAGLSPDSLMVEITEQSLLTDMRRARSVVAALRRRGYRIALDDFGAGYASLGYLREFDVDVVKLDRSFVVSARQDDRSARLLVSVVDLLHGLGTRVLAEGIEDTSDETLVTAAGCDLAQGYHYGRPGPEPVPGTRPPGETARR